MSFSVKLKKKATTKKASTKSNKKEASKKHPAKKASAKKSTTPREQWKFPPLTQKEKDLVDSGKFKEAFRSYKDRVDVGAYEHRLIEPICEHTRQRHQAVLDFRKSLRQAAGFEK